MARPGKKSLYLDAEVVDLLKEEIAHWFFYKWLKLNTMSQVIMALFNEYKERRED